MTQAFNLAQLANNLNTSGQLDATDGLSGLVTNANLASSGTASSNTFLRGDRAWEVPPQKIIQVVLTTTSTSTTNTSGSFQNATGVAASITLASASSSVLILIDSNILLQTTDNINSSGRITRNGTPVATKTTLANYNVNAAMNNLQNFSFNYLDTPGTTSVTYQFQFCQTAFSGSYGPNCLINGGGYSSVTLIEVAA